MSTEDYLWFSLSLRVSGHGVDLDNITRTLGLTPSHSVREGEPVRPGHDRRADQDVWVYDFARKWEKPLGELMTLAEQTVYPILGPLKRLAQEHDVALWCSYQTNLAQGGFDLPPSALRFLSDTGVTLTVSVLSWGEVSD